MELLKKKLLALANYKTPSGNITPLGISSDDTGVYLLFKNNKTRKLAVAQSEDGYNFQLTKDQPFLLTQISATAILNTHFTMDDKNQEFLFYSKDKSGQTSNTLVINNKTTTKATISFTKERAVLIPNYTKDNKRVIIYGERSIKIAYTQNFKQWEERPKPLITEANPSQIESVFLTKSGIALFYFKRHIVNSVTQYQLHMALLDAENPEKILWKSEEALWDQKNNWPTSEVTPLGIALIDDQVMAYWHVDKKLIYATHLNGLHIDLSALTKKRVVLQKHENNPVITPNIENDWESFNTFNPAAVQAGNKVHILYRAQGYDYISHIGYASSEDGFHIDERLNKPVYSPFGKFEVNMGTGVNHDFVSGGGYGGCEDPRATILGDRLYMIYVAFDGWSPPRLAMTSILLQHFLEKKWLWSKPVLISRPGIVDKSGCLLPEKIRGKYVFFHRVFPNILIDYVDDLNFDGKSNWLKGEYQIKVRDNKWWDSRKIGAGAPPIKTDDGWLLIYYGVDDKDASKYHIGAMILDLEYPEKVLYRTNRPILEPTEDYENNGFKAGVAYPCGAVIVDDQLIVYYGGSDSVICIATAELKTFLKEIKLQQTPHLKKIQVEKVTLNGNF